MFDSESYENNRNQNQFPIESSSLIINLLPWSTGKKERILDYGCGTGTTTLAYIVPKAEKSCSTVVGVDISESMIQYAKRSSASGNVTYLEGNIMADTPLPGGSNYDKIISFYALQCIKDYRTALERFYDILKPGGHLGLTIVTRSPQQCHLLQCFGQRKKWKEYMQGYQDFIPYWIENNTNPVTDFEECLKGIGYEILFSRLHEQKHYFEELEPLVAFTTSLNPYYNQIPKDLHPELHQEYREEVTKLWKTPKDTNPQEKWWNNHTHDAFCLVARKPIE